MRWMNGLLRGEWVAGPSFTVADIHLYSFIHELTKKGQSVPEECDALMAWMERVDRRRAADMSLGRWRSGEVPKMQQPKVSS